MTLKYRNIYIYNIALILVFLSSCANLKKTSINDAENILKNELRIKYNSKETPKYILIENASIKIEGKETNKAKINFYLEKDEQIFFSIKLLGFEMMRFQLSNDSVKYINRLNREYYFGAAENVQREIGSLLNFKDLEYLVITGFPFIENSGFDNFFNKSRIDGDSIHFQDVLGPGQRVLCSYSLRELQLFDLAFLDYVKQIETSMNFERNEFGLNAVQGIFVSKGSPTKFSLDINEIKYEKYSKTDFRLGRNYNELKSIL